MRNASKRTGPLRTVVTGVAALAALAVLVGGNAAPAAAGGNLETYDITGFQPSPIPGQLIGKVIPLKWDARCMPVRFRVNSTLNPIPNPLGAASLTVAAVTPVLQDSLNQWNNVPTSFIDMRVVGTTPNPGLPGLDFVNELTFRVPPGADFIGLTPSVNLIADSTLVNGDDIDGDGDSDVKAGIATCADVDGDGDIEFPAGAYKAGTILDADILFNSESYRFTIADAQIDANPSSVDLKAIAVHESGHAHGLSHVIDNNLADNDGTATTMFPFINTAEPASELSQRTVESDDVAWSSFYYPEGSAASGAAALQSGDIAFNTLYGVIRGTVTHGVFNEPIAGASVFVRNLATGRLQSAGFSGTTQLSIDPATGNQFAVSPAFDIVDGKFAIPVRAGIYEVGIAAPDETPVPAFNINTTTTLGAVFGLLDFNEEMWNGPQEAALEVRPGAAVPVVVLPGQSRTGVDFVTNDQINIANFGNLNFIGFTAQSAGSYYAVRFPGSQVLGANGGGDVLIQEGLFRTILVDSSVVPRFAEAILTTGSVSSTGVASIDLAHPLWKQSTFIGRDNDEAPFYFPTPALLGQVFKAGVRLGAFKDLFLVLRIPTTTPFAGINAFPPVVGLDGGVTPNDAPLFGYSYVSTNGTAWSRVTDLNFMFSLVVAKPVP
jgi:hypothetical protein